MQFYSLLLLLFAALAAAQGASSQAKIPVTGMRGGVESSGKRPSRLDIGTLQASGPQWDLYIQAMAAFQAVPESDEKSYFQIVGIHGLPFVAWNGVGQVPGGSAGGYCPHNEILFASWHRPFLALFEQILGEHAKAIAAKYTGSQKATYVAAAETLRMPFWDWAVNPRLPEVTTVSQITINSPTGRKSIRNPLLSYRFQRFPFSYPGFGGTIGQYPQTMRCPSSANSQARSRHDVVNSNLARDAQYLKNSVYLAFTRTNTFTIMSTDGEGGFNFESPHNTVHNDVGCGNPSGHMTNLGWSAFDPIFMLHHAHVDRMVAMWQAAHPRNPMFGGTHTLGSGMFGSAGGSSFDSHTGLKPFYTPDGSSFWTSWGVRSTRAFGYTYPELQDWTVNSASLQRSVIATINRLYGSATMGARRVRRGEIDGRHIAVRADGTETQYAAEISVDRSDVELPSTINMYLADEFAGSFALLSMPKTGLSYGNIPLQAPLAKFAANAGEKPQDTVVRMLKQALRVEMVTPDGKTKNIMNVPSLKVTLEASTIKPAANEYEFPTYMKTDALNVQIKDLVDSVVEGVKDDIKDKLDKAPLPPSAEKEIKDQLDSLNVTAPAS